MTIKPQTVLLTINDITFTIILAKHTTLPNDITKNKNIYLKDNFSYNDVQKIVIAATMLAYQPIFTNYSEIARFVSDNMLDFQCNTNMLFKMLTPHTINSLYERS